MFSGGVGGVGYGSSEGGRRGPIAGTEAAEQLSMGPGVRDWVGNPFGKNARARSMERSRWA